MHASIRRGPASTRRLRRGGFTLVELLVVIAIIGILASIVTVNLGSAQKKARDSRRTADIKSIQLALSLYYNDNGMYPKNIYAASNIAAPDGGLAPAYLPIVPRDPKATGAENCAGVGANGLAGCYKYNGYTTASSQICNTTNTPVLYHMGASFEDTTNAALLQDSDANTSLSNIYSTTYYACNNSPAPTAAFHGWSQDCNATTGTAEINCYDLTP